MLRYAGRDCIRRWCLSSSRNHAGGGSAVRRYTASSSCADSRGSEAVTDVARPRITLEQAVASTIQKVQALRHVLQRSNNLVPKTQSEPLLRSVDAAMQRMDDSAFRVAVVGAVRAGKSPTLAGLLIEDPGSRRYADPADPPTTGDTFAYDASIGVGWRTKGTAVHVIGKDHEGHGEAQAYTHSAYPDQYRSVFAAHNVTFVDTPGIGFYDDDAETVAAKDAEILAIARESDMVLMVTDAVRQLDTQHEQDVLRSIGHSNVVVVYNRDCPADPSLSPAIRASYVSDGLHRVASNARRMAGAAVEQLSHAGPTVVSVSPSMALSAAASVSRASWNRHAEHLLQESGIPDLASEIAQIATDFDKDGSRRLKRARLVLERLHRAAAVWQDALAPRSDILEANQNMMAAFRTRFAKSRDALLDQFRVQHLASVDAHFERIYGQLDAHGQSYDVVAVTATTLQGKLAEETHRAIAASAFLEDIEMRMGHVGGSLAELSTHSLAKAYDVAVSIHQRAPTHDDDGGRDLLEKVNEVLAEGGYSVGEAADSGHEGALNAVAPLDLERGGGSRYTTTLVDVVKTTAKDMNIGNSLVNLEHNMRVAVYQACGLWSAGVATSLVMALNDFSEVAAGGTGACLVIGGVAWMARQKRHVFNTAKNEFANAHIKLKAELKTSYEAEVETGIVHPVNRVAGLCEHVLDVRKQELAAMDQKLRELAKQKVETR